jgi:uncharacterized membrane protein YdbT with pleckstrin-like domain
MSDFDETIVYQGRPSWLNYYLLYVIGIILFGFLVNVGEIIGGFFVLLIVLGLAAILRYRYLFTVTKNRIISREGLIAKNTNEIQLKHIRALNVKQGIIGRLLGIGTIEISSAAGGGVEVMFKGIRDPHGVKENIRNL